MLCAIAIYNGAMDKRRSALIFLAIDTYLHTYVYSSVIKAVFGLTIYEVSIIIIVNCATIMVNSTFSLFYIYKITYTEKYIFSARKFILE